MPALQQIGVTGNQEGCGNSLKIMRHCSPENRSAKRKKFKKIYDVAMGDSLLSQARAAILKWSIRI
jgi:hypothetical protein